jgi:hypothetical protein
MGQLDSNVQSPTAALAAAVAAAWISRMNVGNLSGVGFVRERKTLCHSEVPCNGAPRPWRSGTSCEFEKATNLKTVFPSLWRFRQLLKHVAFELWANWSQLAAR